MSHNMTENASSTEGISAMKNAGTTIATIAASATATVLLALAAHAEMPKTAAPEGAAVYFISPTAGETVSSPFTVRFGLKGMGVGPAGLDNPKTGHHHLIIDAPLPDPDLPIPSDAHYRHFGGGQTEVRLELPAGQHTLQLMLGDKNHVPHTKPLVSEKITITVK
jgi:hypothetical protein